MLEYELTFPKSILALQDFGIRQPVRKRYGESSLWLINGSSSFAELDKKKMVAARDKCVAGGGWMYNASISYQK